MDFRLRFIIANPKKVGFAVVLLHLAIINY